MATTSQNETYNDEKARAAITAMTDELTSCSKSIENIVEGAATLIATKWEDPNAMEFMKKFRDGFETAVDDLDKNNKIFAEMVCSILNTYKAVAGDHNKFHMTPPVIKVSIDVSAVQAQFGDGSVGFKQTTSEALTQDIKKIGSKIEALGGSLQRKVESIEAFGNVRVRSAAGKTAKAVTDILKDCTDEIVKSGDQYIQKTMETYSSTGTKSSSAMEDLGHSK